MIRDEEETMQVEKEGGETNKRKVVEGLGPATYPPKQRKIGRNLKWKGGKKKTRTTSEDDRQEEKEEEGMKMMAEGEIEQNDNEKEGEENEEGQLPKVEEEQEEPEVQIEMEVTKSNSRHYSPEKRIPNYLMSRSYASGSSTTRSTGQTSITRWRRKGKKKIGEEDNEEENRSLEEEVTSRKLKNERNKDLRTVNEVKK
jgi:hypothetical protein